MRMTNFQRMHNFRLTLTRVLHDTPQHTTSTFKDRTNVLTDVAVISRIPSP